MLLSRGNTRLNPRSTFLCNFNRLCVHLESNIANNKPQLDDTEVKSMSHLRSITRNKKENCKHTLWNNARYPMGSNRQDRLPISGHSEMSITFVGTASCMPSASRGTSCTAL